MKEAGWAPELVWTQGLEKNTFTSAGDRISIAREKKITMKKSMRKR
jgi:hypothetical protein